MSSRKHGMARTRIYGIWRSMRTRCENPSCDAYQYYGARGIRVCERWQSFENFYEDMGERPPGKSLERKDNDKGYSPDNCIWAGLKSQSRNRHGIRMMTANGETRSMGEWAEVTGLSVGAIWNRIKLGWSDGDAINTPKVMRKRSSHKARRLAREGSDL